MKEEFLEAIRPGDIDMLKALLQNNAKYRGIYGYCNRETELANFEHSKEKKENLTDKTFSFTKTHAIDTMCPDDWDNIAYKTWHHLSRIDLKFSTITQGLLIAAENGDLEILKLLLDGGFEQNSVTILKSTPENLMKDPKFKDKFFDNPGYAIQFMPADPKCENTKGQSALELAVNANARECVFYLLKVGARSNEKTDSYCRNLIPSLLQICTPQEKLKLSARWESEFPLLFKPIVPSLPQRLMSFAYQSLPSLPSWSALLGSQNQIPWTTLDFNSLASPSLEAQARIKEAPTQKIKLR